MVVAAREVPRVRVSDFANVSADGTGDGTAVCGSVSRVRHHADDGEMVVFYVLDPDSDCDGFARAAAAGRGQRAGLCGGTAVLGICAAGPRTRGFSHVALAASANAGIRGWNSGWNPWRGLRKPFVVGLGSRVQSGARSRGHGNGRRENDGHDRGVSRITRYVPDPSGGQPSGKRDRDWPYRGVVLRGLEERGGEAREPPGTGDGAPIAMGDCAAIPVAAGNVFGDWSAGDRVWETADCGLLA